MLAIALVLGVVATVTPAAAQTRGVAPTHAGEASRWQLEAAVQVTAPTSADFSEGWGAGYGLMGSLRRALGPWLQLGIEADFAQFGFTGLEGFGPLGGARRQFGVAVPLHVRVWENRSPGRERVMLAASAGWGWQQIDGTFDSSNDTDISYPVAGDGLRVSGEVRFSRLLYRRTRWMIGARFTSVALDEETPQYIGLFVGAGMPLSGSRP
jgi:hypothetical protein